jgi:hypothetical protein
MDGRSRRASGKPAPKEILKSWAEQWLKEGVKVDWENLLSPGAFQVLPRRWVVARTFSWVDQNRRMSKDYERLTETSEAVICVTMSRLTAKRDWPAREAFGTVSLGDSRIEATRSLWQHVSEQNVLGTALLAQAAL